MLKHILAAASFLAHLIRHHKGCTLARQCGSPSHDDDDNQDDNEGENDDDNASEDDKDDGNVFLR